MLRCYLFVLCLLQIATVAESRLGMQSLNSSDTFANAHISKATQTRIAELLEQNSVDWDRGRLSQLRARRVSLMPEKNDGLALLSTATEDCGATGNCFFTILQQNEKGWRVVLRETAIEGFTIINDTHHGLYDIKLSTNDSAESSLLYVAAFDGNEYHFIRCSRVVERKGGNHSFPIPCPSQGTE